MNGLQVSEVKLAGGYLGKDDKFKSLMTVCSGEDYNADKIAETTKALVSYFGDFGFAFARVVVKPEIDRSKNQVALILTAEPGQRAYVRRINISGNNERAMKLFVVNSVSLSHHGMTEKN